MASAKRGSGIKIRLYQPRRDAWAIKKGRQIIVHFRASRTAIDEIIEQQNRGKAQVAVNEICLLEPHALLDQ